MASNNKYSSAANNDDVIDLGRLFYYMYQGAKRYWFLVFVIPLLAILGFVYAKLTYIPQYQVEASIIVTDSISSEQTSGDLTLAAQMGETFSYIVNSDLLRNVVTRDLGVESIDSTITASAVEGTNLLTIRVQDPDPQRAFDVMNSVLSNYPEISDYVLGATKIEVVQMGDVPTSPVNLYYIPQTAVRAALAGFVVWILLLFLYAYTRKTAGSADDVHAISNAECLATLPRTRLKKHGNAKNDRLLVIQKNISQGLVEGFRNLANRVEQDSSDASHPKKIYAVTSTVAGEGKTTVAINLAIVLARRNKRVLLIDADLREASATSVLKMEQEHNTLETFLRGKTPWKDCLHQYRNMPLYVLPTQKVASGADVMRILSVHHLKGILGYAARDFDYVIVDTPPIGILADATAVLSVSDGVILTVKQDYAQLQDIAETSSRITENGGRLFGFVMNQVEGLAGGYGYGYRYGYGYGYGQGYRYNSGEYADKSV